LMICGMVDCSRAVSCVESMSVASLDGQGKLATGPASRHEACTREHYVMVTKRDASECHVLGWLHCPNVRFVPGWDVESRLADEVLLASRPTGSTSATPARLVLASVPNREPARVISTESQVTLRKVGPIVMFIRAGSIVPRTIVARRRGPSWASIDPRPGFFLPPAPPPGFSPSFLFLSQSPFVRASPRFALFFLDPSSPSLKPNSSP
jgi:hypothetical protein